MTVVKQDGWALEFAPYFQSRNKEIVTAWGIHNRVAHKFESEDVQRDREIVMATVKHYGESLKFALENIHKNREIVMTAVKMQGGNSSSHQRIFGETRI